MVGYFCRPAVAQPTVSKEERRLPAEAADSTILAVRVS